MEEVTVKLTSAIVAVITILPFPPFPLSIVASSIIRLAAKISVVVKTIPWELSKFNGSSNSMVRSKELVIDGA